MAAPRGWAFLVARGRRAGYRTVLAPGFLLEAGLLHLLEESTGLEGLDASNTGLARREDTPVGPISIAYTRERLTLADLEQADPDGGELPTDEHGRPLEMAYGVVSRDPLEAPVDPEDLRTARADAVRSYRSFLDDEEGHEVGVSTAFVLHTRGRPAAAAAAATSDDPAHAPASTVTGPDAPIAAPAADARARHAPAPTGPGRRGRRRALQVGLLAVGVVLVLVAVILLTGGASADAVHTSWLSDAPRGAVTFCAGADVSASHRRAAQDFNRRYAPGARATFEESSFTADAQHDQYIKALERGSDGCDVIYLDVIYTAEFASKGLLYDMTPYLVEAGRRATFDPRAMRSAAYDGKLWGVPKQLDVGLLYYRADRATKPTSWQDVYRQATPRAGDLPGLRLQRGAFEGMTVVFLELAYAAGARPIVSQDGTIANLDQPQAVEALEFMRDAIRDRVTPDAQQTDIGNLAVYERGRASFLRGWPFVAARIRADAGADADRRAAAANTAIVALPPWSAGGASVGVLGGHNLVIPHSARNPSAALHLVEFLTSAGQVRKDVAEDSQLPVRKDVAMDAAVRKRPVVRAIEATRVVARPTLTRYAAVSRIISRGVTAILERSTKASIRAALKELQRDVQRELDAGQP